MNGIVTSIADWRSEDEDALGGWSDKFSKAAMGSVGAGGGIAMEEVDALVFKAESSCEVPWVELLAEVFDALSTPRLFLWRAMVKVRTVVDAKIGGWGVRLQESDQSDGCPKRASKRRCCGVRQRCCGVSVC